MRAHALRVTLIVAGLTVSGCEPKQGACFFDGEFCSQGSSYEGKRGISLCQGNGGSWQEDGCPFTDACLGKCDHGSSWVYFYWPKFKGLADARAGCKDGTWTDGCDGRQPKVPDWFTTPCSELGGTTTATGACFLPCSTGCKVEKLSCGQGYQDFCRVTSCSTAADCGPDPKHWVCGYGCYLRCSTDSGGAQSSECPSGWSCGGDSEKMCIHKIGSSGSTCGGSPCPKGCCSSSGRTCCGPPFCSGECAGSPCC